MSLPPQVIVPSNGNGLKATQFQIWQCSECSRRRQWGFGRPEPNSLLNPPLLNCSNCDEPTRHVYSSLVFSRKHVNIDFGQDIHWYTQETL